MGGIMKQKPSRRKRIIFGLICIAVSLFLSLSIIFYHTTDYDLTVDNKIKNITGILGAYSAYHLIQYTFGYAVLIPCLLLFFWGVSILKKTRIAWLPRFTLYSLVTMFLISFGLALIFEPAIRGSRVNYEYSGLVGGYFSFHSILFLGTIGTLIIYLTALIIMGVMWVHFFSAGSLEKAEAFVGRTLPLPNRFIQNVRRVFARNRRKKELKSAITQQTEPTEEIDIPFIPKRESPGKPESAVSIPTLPRPAKLTPAESALQKGVPHKEAAEAENAQRMTSDEATKTESVSRHYKLPPLHLLDNPPVGAEGDSRDDILKKAETLENTLLDFGVFAKVAEVHPGPVLTLYEVHPDTGVKINKILALQDDLALALKAKGIRIIAPIPGKDTVGIEIPNNKPSIVYLKNLLTDPGYKRVSSDLTIPLGKTITGETYFADLSKMPHLLIAGSTGSGKSVGISTIISSILFKSTPEDVQFIMIDPKMLELSIFKKLSGHHLLAAPFLDEQVVTKPYNAVAILRSCVIEMENRYKILAKAGVRSIDDYNAKSNKPINSETGEPYPETLEKIVIVIDELADLMMVATKDVEEPIARLAQMARAVGIHLVLATQRPSVDVITGVIKANFPARIAYQVASKVDSRTILDMNGAETLLGSGDMLFLPPGAPKPVRLQNAYISPVEIERVVDYIASQPKFAKTTILESEKEHSSKKNGSGFSADERDPLFVEAARLVVMHQQGSISLLQRRLKIGYSRAARLIDELEAAGIVGAYDGSKARQVLIEDINDLENLLE